MFYGGNQKSLPDGTGGNKSETIVSVWDYHVCNLSRRISALSDSVADPGKYLRSASDAGGSDDKSDQTGAGQDRSGLSDRDHAADVYPGRRWSDRDLERFKGNSGTGSCNHLYHDRLCYGCDRKNGTGSNASERKHGSTEDGEAGLIG